LPHRVTPTLVTPVTPLHKDPFSSFYVKLLINRQTDKQTPGERTSLAKVKTDT